MAQPAIAPRRVLILYWTPTPPSEIRSAIRHHLEAIRYGPSRHHVTYWNAFEGSPAVLRHGTYDAILLHTTLLCLRWFPTFQEWRRKLSWVAGLDCLKIALPQDEYDHSEVLDEWLRDLGVQHVFSNFGEDVRPVLYPGMSRSAVFHPAFTGYIDEDTARRLEGRLQPAAARPYDVVYRASHLPYWFGSLGQLKHRIGARAKAEAEARGLVANVSTRTEDAIMGDEWFDFLGAGRSVVGCESGSSALDRRGEIQASIRRYLEQHPEAGFDEVSAHLPEGWDSYHFAAVSPRHFEAVITRTCQVLVRGRYDGVLVAGRHYLPVSPDLSDLGEVLESAADPGTASAVAETAYEEVYRSGRYGYRGLAELIDRVLDTRAVRRPGAGAVASAVSAAWGTWRLKRPSEIDSSWTVSDPELSRGAAELGPPARQVARLLRDRTGRGLVRGAAAGRVSRPLLRAYLGAGDEAASISAARLLAEARLLDRMARAQTFEPRTPVARVIKASESKDALDLRLLRSEPEPDGADSRLTSWPPPSIHVRVPSFRGTSATRLDAIGALAAVRPAEVKRAVRPLLDDLGGARSRPRVRGRRSSAKTALAMARLVARRPADLWFLARAAGRAPLGDVADDLLKLALLEDARDRSDVAVEVEPGTRMLRLVTRPGGPTRPAGDAAAVGELDADRIVWDNSAASRYVFAPVALGRRLTVFLGAGGVHEFTGVEALPEAARRAILRRIARPKGGGAS